MKNIEKPIEKIQKMFIIKKINIKLNFINFI